MEEINLMQEINAHICGVNRMKVLEDVFISDKKTRSLSNDIVKLCRDRNVSYQEALKAIIYADNSLYFNAKA